MSVITSGLYDNGDTVVKVFSGSKPADIMNEALNPHCAESRPASTFHLLVEISVGNCAGCLIQKVEA